MQLKNVEGFDEARLLSDIKEFHSMPDSEKRKLYSHHHNPENSNLYHGFTPFIDNDASHKEFMDMGVPVSEISDDEMQKILVERTPMPSGPNYDDLTARYLAHEAFMRRVSLKMAEYIALGLGKDRNYFRSWFDPAPLATFRTIKYLPRS